MAFDYTRFNILPVLAGGVVFMIVGSLWYGPLFAKAWMQLIGKTEEQIRASMAGTSMGTLYGLSFVAAVLTAYVLSLFIDATMMTSAKEGACVGLLAALGLVGTSFTTNYLFNQKPIKLWMIDVGYHVVCFTIVGAIVGGWR